MSLPNTRFSGRVTVVRLTGAQKNLSAKTLTDLGKLTVGVLVLSPLVGPGTVSVMKILSGSVIGVGFIVGGLWLIKEVPDASGR